MINSCIKISLFLLLIISSFYPTIQTFAYDNKVLHRGNGAEPDTLDPHLATGSWEGNVINDLFIGLYTKNKMGIPVRGSSLGYLKTNN